MKGRQDRKDRRKRKETTAMIERTDRMKMNEGGKEGRTEGLRKMDRKKEMGGGMTEER